MLVLAETPSNPRLELADLDELGSIKGPFTLVDSTFATPLGQQPLAHGVDISLHSATKGIAGHNDATLGVISGEADLLGEIWAYSVLHGATPSPFDALNALRGIRTLGVRTRQQNETARSLAGHPRRPPRVVAVHYPGLSEHPQHDLATKQLRQYGTVLSFEVADRDAAATLPRLAADRPGRHVARWTGDDRVPPGHVDARQPDARRTGERPVSPTVCCGCRSASRTAATSSPTSNAPSPPPADRSCIGAWHEHDLLGDRWAAGPNSNQWSITAAIRSRVTDPVVALDLRTTASARA